MPYIRNRLRIITTFKVNIRIEFTPRNLGYLIVYFRFILDKAIHVFGPEGGLGSSPFGWLDYFRDGFSYPLNVEKVVLV